MHNYDLDKKNLFIKQIQAQKGLTLKRWTPRAHGRATPILRRRSHIYLELDEIKESKGEKKGKKSKMQVVTYKEVQEALKKAKKTAKTADKAVKEKKPPKESLTEKKEIVSRPKF